MDSSDSSSEDDINIYTNAAKKLKELNSKIKVQLPKSDEDNSVDDDDIICRDDSPSVAASHNTEKLENLAKDKLCSSDSDLSSDSLKDKECQIESNKVDEDPIEILDEDSSNDCRISTRSTLKRKVKNSKKKSVIPKRVKHTYTIDDSFEELLDDNYDNSFQLSQEDNDDCVVIGSPPPAKKSNNDYEVSVKVLWKSNKLERFEVRRHETFQKIFMHFAKLEGVPEDQIRITNKGKRINPLDSPISADWSILDIYDGGIVSAEVAKKKHVGSAQDAESANTCKIKIQTSEKGTLNITIKKTDTFEVLLNDCSKQLDVPASKIKFYFDGELVHLDETPETLDLDDENCFDLKIVE